MEAVVRLIHCVRADGLLNKYFLFSVIWLVCDMKIPEATSLLFIE